MKKTGFLLLVLSLFAAPSALRAQFESITNTDEISVTITGYTGVDGDVTIPTNINGLLVTSIGNYAFASNSVLASVNMSGGITNIGAGVFQDCTALTRVTMDNSLNDIGMDAFMGCSNLTSVTIPGSVTNIGNYAFETSGLIALYFSGNPPAGGDLWFNSSNATLFYLPGNEVHNELWLLFAAANGQCIMWNPVIQTGDGNFGVRNNQFGFNINNFPHNHATPPPFPPLVAYGPSVVVEVCTNLANPVWTPIQTVRLTNGSVYFSEPLQTNLPYRFYGLGFP